MRPVVLRPATRRALTHSLLIWPPIAIAWVLVVSFRSDAIAFDFTHAYLPAARDVLAGHSPYPPATLAAFAPRTAFVYPPLLAFLVAPFTLVPAAVATAVVSLLAVACIPCVLWLLNVRDWRCYMIVFLWVPTYSAIQTANVTLLLTALLAVLWRYRQRRAVTAVVTGLLVALKLFLWPLFIWLLATRRIRTAGGAVATAALLVVVPWAGIGFSDLQRYPHLLSLLTQAEGWDSYSLAALLAGLANWRVAEYFGVLVGLAILLGVVRVGAKDERRAFALAIASALAMTPIVNMHYFVFLVVVLALYRPRLGPVWALPLALWIGPQVGNGAGWQTAAVVTIATATIVLATQRLRVRLSQPSAAEASG